MLRSVGSKVAWVGRTASMVFGLALVLALMFGLASAAFGANGDFFKVGRNNLADSMSTLTKSGAGPALHLKVGSGPPLAVNSEARVNKLNADKVDGQDAEALKPLLAVIERDGALSTNNRGVASAQRIDTGIYEVTFDRDISSCPRVGSVAAPLTTKYLPDPNIFPIGSQPIDGHLTTFTSTNGDDKIGVLTRNSSGTLDNRDFQLAVYC